MTPVLALLALAAPPALDALLPDAGDVALVRALKTGELVLAHHPGAARRKLAPGSVMKAFTAYALLRAGAHDVARRCVGAHRDAAGVERPCWLRRGHGELSLRRALAESCNAWFYGAVAELEAARLAEGWRELGIDAPIDEASKLDRAVGDDRALELSAEVLLEATSRLARRDARLDGASVERVAEGLHEAARSGTLSAELGGLDVAAKSGTGPQKGGRGTVALVIGWAPARSPEYAFVVVRSRGRGARDAGPAARAIVESLP